MTDIEQRLAAAGLRVKPLEWEQSGQNTWKSGRYTVFFDNGWHAFFNEESLYERGWRGYRRSASEDKCNTHNAAAILSSLEVIE